MEKLGAKYIANLRRHNTMLVRSQRSSGIAEKQSFKIQKSKPIVDEIDKVPALNYGFTDDELDFIVNDDINYGIGR